MFLIVVGLSTYTPVIYPNPADQESDESDDDNYPQSPPGYQGGSIQQEVYTVAPSSVSVSYAVPKTYTVSSYSPMNTTAPLPSLQRRPDPQPEFPPPPPTTNESFYDDEDYPPPPPPADMNYANISYGGQMDNRPGSPYYSSSGRSVSPGYSDRRSASPGYPDGRDIGNRPGSPGYGDRRDIGPRAGSPGYPDRRDIGLPPGSSGYSDRRDVGPRAGSPVYSDRRDIGPSSGYSDRQDMGPSSGYSDRRDIGPRPGSPGYPDRRDIAPRAGSPGYSTTRSSTQALPEGARSRLLFTSSAAPVQHGFVQSRPTGTSSGPPANQAPSYGAPQIASSRSQGQPVSASFKGQGDTYPVKGVKSIVVPLPSNQPISSPDTVGKEAEVDALTSLLMQNMEAAAHPDFFGKLPWRYIL